jgi:hypothetical protein
LEGHPPKKVLDQVQAMAVTAGRSGITGRGAPSCLAPPGSRIGGGLRRRLCLPRFCLPGTRSGAGRTTGAGGVAVAVQPAP